MYGDVWCYMGNYLKYLLIKYLLIFIWGVAVLCMPCVALVNLVNPVRCSL